MVRLRNRCRSSVDASKRGAMQPTVGMRTMVPGLTTSFNRFLMTAPRERASAAWSAVTADA